MGKAKIYLLSPTKYPETISMPMIRFEATAEHIDFQEIDTLMFTSKQAVVRANEIGDRWKKFPSIAIGRATRDMILSLGGKVIFVPEEYYGKTLSEDIRKHLSNRKILYLRPQEVSFDSRRFLKKHGIDLKEQVIYKTTCVPYTIEDAPEKNSVIIFTSPSTIKCFFKAFLWDDSYKAVVIGDSTIANLPSNIRAEVARVPLITACIEKAKEISLDDIH